MIDFREIDWRTGDHWQEFAAEFLRVLGFRIEMPPSRGPDGGRDLLVIEDRQAPQNALEQFKWLVSCKHTAHSGTAIGTTQEYRITDSVRQSRADGFMGFYSVGPSTALITALDSFKQSGDVRDWRIFTGADIASIMVNNRLDNIMFRFFPNNFLRAKGISMSFGDYIGLNCFNCNRDILKDAFDGARTGSIVYDSDLQADIVVNVHITCCVCHDLLDAHIQSQQRVSAFENLEAFLNPFVYSDKVRDPNYYVTEVGGLSFTQNALAQHARILAAIGQYISVRGGSPDPQEQRKLRTYYESYSGIFGVPPLD